MTTQPKPQIAVEDAVAFGVLAAVGAYAAITAWSDYDLFNEGNRVGPGLLPVVVGSLIALIAGSLLVLTLTGRRARHDQGLAEVTKSVAADLPAEALAAEPDDAGAGDDDVDIFGRTPAQRMRQLQMVTVALVVSLFLVSVLGLLGALGLFGLFVSIVVERRPWLPSVLITAASVGVVYGVFAVFLEVPLPTGALGIGG